MIKRRNQWRPWIDSKHAISRSVEPEYNKIIIINTFLQDYKRLDHPCFISITRLNFFVIFWSTPDNVKIHIIPYSNKSTSCATNTRLSVALILLKILIKKGA